jgi:AraC family transcriptional regulator
MSDTAPPRWRLCLADPPRIHWLGAGTHGPGDFRWRLPDLWCVHLYNYMGELRVDGVLLHIRPGTISVLPAGAELEYRFYKPSEHLCSHFRPATGRADRAVPALQDLGADFASYDRQFRYGVSWWGAEPRRAEARLWDILWSLSTPAAAAPHPLVERARREIEMRLGQPMRIAGLAKELGTSHNHLVRLFKAELGTTPAAWIRSRRAHRARHLLARSSMSISAVAAEVGVPNAQHFNKLIRRELGGSPREIRARG